MWRPDGSSRLIFQRNASSTKTMHTPFDFASVALFALIAVIYLHRSSKPEEDTVPLWAYAATAALCAVGDVAANAGYVIPGVLCLLLALGASAWIVFRPTSPAN